MLTKWRDMNIFGGSKWNHKWKILQPNIHKEHTFLTVKGLVLPQACINVAKLLDAMMLLWWVNSWKPYHSGLWEECTDASFHNDDMVKGRPEHERMMSNGDYQLFLAKVREEFFHLIGFMVDMFDGKILEWIQTRPHIIKEIWNIPI